MINAQPHLGFFDEHVIALRAVCASYGACVAADGSVVTRYHERGAAHASAFVTPETCVGFVRA